MGKCFLRRTLYSLSIVTLLTARIKAAYINCPVRPYISSLFRCFKWQHYVQTTTTCRGSVTCDGLQKSATMVNLSKTVNIMQTIRINIKHTFALVQTDSVKKKFFLSKLLINLFSRTPFVGVSNSSLSSSKPVRQIRNQIESSFPRSNSHMTLLFQHFNKKNPAIFTVPRWKTLTKIRTLAIIISACYFNRQNSVLN